MMAGLLLHRPAHAALDVAHVLHHQGVRLLGIVLADGVENLAVIFAVSSAMPRTHLRVQDGCCLHRQVGECVHQHDQWQVARTIGDRAVELAGCLTRIGRSTPDLVFLLDEHLFESRDVLRAGAKCGEPDDGWFDEHSRFRQFLVRSHPEPEDQRKRAADRFVIELEDEGASLGTAEDVNKPLFLERAIRFPD